MTDNIITMTDVYKTTHYNMYRPNTSFIYSYLESRNNYFDKMLFFGLQGILLKYFVGRQVTKEKIEQAKKIIGRTCLGGKFNEDGWNYILNEHDGKLPLEIQAVPEGTLLGNKNAVITIQNTDPNCAWLTNYVESLLLHVWAPITVASQGHYFKSLIKEALIETSDVIDPENRFVDFSLRGVSSLETARICGAAHLVNFDTTDNLPAIEYVEEYYNANTNFWSIPASEHSVSTCWGDKEKEYVENALEKYPTGFISLIGDTYNIFKFTSDVIYGLKDKIEQRDGGIVIRPDSGDTVETLLRILNIIEEKWGVKYNSKGYKVIDAKIAIIQGDNVNINTLPLIIDALKNNKWSLSNLVFGSGGGNCQKISRDTMDFAIKNSASHIDGKWIDVQKRPIGQASKISKKGRFSLIDEDGEYKTIPFDYELVDSLHTVFYDGELTKFQNFDSIRANLKRHSN